MKGLISTSCPEIQISYKTIRNIGEPVNFQPVESTRWSVVPHWLVHKKNPCVAIRVNKGRLMLKVRTPSQTKAVLCKPTDETL